MITLAPLDRHNIRIAQLVVSRNHYLHTQVDARCSVEGYSIAVNGITAGYFILGRPQATRCADWYGSVEDVTAGRCSATRWQVLNLARVYIYPEYQPGGKFFNPSTLPGFTDRKGQFRSVLASDAVKLLAARVGYDYLIARPPCFLDEPFEICWLMSYCDTRLHKGTIYRQSGFELYRTNADGIQTWRIHLPDLTIEQVYDVCEAARKSKRSQAYRAKRAQMALPIG